MSNQESPLEVSGNPDSLTDQVPTPSLFLVVLLSAMAGGMGWGIRGQYGHETGAMIAGALVALVLAFFFCPRVSSLFTARAVALMTVAIGFGGSMTYGQTVGLTHDAPLIGNTEALTWGMVGLFIKGGLWIAFAGAFLGIGLSRVDYKPTEIASLLVLMVFLLFLGVFLINHPFDPAEKILPNVYFSDHWFWEPDSELKPRPERWGGLFFALVGLLVYVSIIKRDKLAQVLTLFGFLAGGFGFSLGQSVQAYHAWHPEVFEVGIFAKASVSQVISHFNWWNMMETTFGAVFGGILGLGVWLNRGLIRTESTEDQVEMTPANEWLLVLVHVAALLAWNFLSYPALDQFADHAITMGLLPIFGIVAGRYWPFLITLPIVILPIAGKTIRQLVYGTKQIEEPLGWVVYGVVPVALALIIALIQIYRSKHGQTGRNFARWALLYAAWAFFCLNIAFFDFSWPWAPLEDWTGRTPNAAIFGVCLIFITLMTLVYGWRSARPIVPVPVPQTEDPPAEA